jgi:hypothetical protein
MAMKIKIIIIGSCCVLLVLSALYQFGPIGTPSDSILASVAIETGSKLYVVAHKTTDPIKTYEVSLYRVDQDTNVSVCFLGGKEAFWWGCSLSPETMSDTVKIKVFWQTVAVYSNLDGSVIWSDKQRGIFPSYKIDGKKTNGQFLI